LFFLTQFWGKSGWCFKLKVGIPALGLCDAGGPEYHITAAKYTNNLVRNGFELATPELERFKNGHQDRLVHVQSFDAVLLEQFDFFTDRRNIISRIHRWCARFMRVFLG
jgi:hypothetical protein